MRENRALLQGLLGVVLLAGFGAGSTQGAISACAGATLSTLAAAAGNTPTGGCGAVDIAFNGFTQSSGSVGLASIALANLTGGAVSGAGISQSITPIVATFFPPSSDTLTHS